MSGRMVEWVVPCNMHNVCPLIFCFGMHIYLYFILALLSLSVFFCCLAFPIYVEDLAKHFGNGIWWVKGGGDGVDGGLRVVSPCQAMCAVLGVILFSFLRPETVRV